MAVSALEMVFEVVQEEVAAVELNNGSTVVVVNASDEEVPRFAERPAGTVMRRAVEVPTF